MPFLGKEQLLFAIELIDAGILRALPLARSSSEKNTVVSAFLFHRFFCDDEPGPGVRVYPHEGVTVELFETTVRLLRERGFNFVLPSDLTASAPPRGNSALLTVDDGYADNLRILDVLKKHDAKAALFVSAAHIRDNERFWPDALWIGAGSLGWSRGRTMRCLRQLTRLPHAEVVRSLKMWFGESILTPAEFTDRPLNPDELRALARSPFIEIGCHAFNHTILSPRPTKMVRDQLNGSIEYLESVTGRRPMAIAYPNGVYSDSLVRVCREIGFTVGLTIEPRNNFESDITNEDSRMKLGRFTISGKRNLNLQLDSAMTPISLSRTLYGIRSHKTPTSPARRDWT